MPGAPDDPGAPSAKEDTMHTIRYVQKIKKRGPFGIPYTALVVRAAHVDEENWRRLRRRRFSMDALLIY